ncbi:MAG: shikimate kinase [Rhodospirillaceae bacterium]|nr:shikimate kinase [Rhodospirillales bacterium]
MAQDMAEGIAPRLTRPIVLVGLMGAGKSCVGRRLAARLGLPFLDSDVEFEAAAGCTIAEFFAQYGEPAFREGERKVIARLMEGPHCVLATGGGAFCDPETRARIQDEAISVWIRADLDLLVKRTSGRDHRPLLKQGDPREILARLMDARYPLYAQAHIIVDTTDEPPEVTVAKVVDELALYLEHLP